MKKVLVKIATAIGVVVALVAVFLKRKDIWNRAWDATLNKPIGRTYDAGKYQGDVKDIEASIKKKTKEEIVEKFKKRFS